MVCMINERDTLFLDCGHRCVCKGCADSYMQKFSVCPICRARIKRCIKIYNS